MPGTHPNPVYTTFSPYFSQSTLGSGGVRCCVAMDPYLSLYIELKDEAGFPAENHTMSLEDIFIRLEHALLRNKLAVYSMPDIVERAYEAVVKKTLDKDKSVVVKELTRLGLLTLLLTAKYCLRENTVLSGVWERVAFKAVTFIGKWKPRLFEPNPALTKRMKWWVVLAVSCSTLCPSAELRVELLRFVAMLNVEDIEMYMSDGLVTAFFKNVEHMTECCLVPQDGVGLLPSLFQILCLMHGFGILQRLLSIGATNIAQLRVFQVEQAMVHLLVLMSKAAKRLIYMRIAKYISPEETVENLQIMVNIVNLLVAQPQSAEFFETPGVFQIVAASIATITSCVFKVHGVSSVGWPFTNLLTSLSKIFVNLLSCGERGAVLEEMRRYHQQTLSFVDHSRKQLGYPFIYFPKPLLTVESEDVPETFLDSRTGRVMETPVMLEESQQVVDRSTVLSLLLATNIDPETLQPMLNWSYTLLPELQQEITAWRTSTKKRKRV